MIRHRPFNAQLPGEFRDESDVQTAFANILVGGIHPGSGDFTYRGQALTLLEPLDLTLLPARPAMQKGSAHESWVYTALANVGFEAGFEPVSEVMFNRVKELEAGWRANIAHAAKHAQARSAEVWAQAVNLRLEVLNDPSDEVPGYGQEEFAELRSYYPELYAFGRLPLLVVGWVPDGVPLH
uniref:hypothetical protein n=1 Tax=Pseudomonas TaxID=286 RepID=UPI001EEACF3A|nr:MULTISPECIES: hypothetical protein [Pseudomonas]